MGHAKTRHVSSHCDQICPVLPSFPNSDPQLVKAELRYFSFQERSFGLARTSRWAHIVCSRPRLRGSGGAEDRAREKPAARVCPSGLPWDCSAVLTSLRGAQPRSTWESWPACHDQSRCFKTGLLGVSGEIPRLSELGTHCHRIGKLPMTTDCVVW